MRAMKHHRELAELAGIEGLALECLSSDSLPP